MDKWIIIKTISLTDVLRNGGYPIEFGNILFQYEKATGRAWPSSCSISNDDIMWDIVQRFENVMDWLVSKGYIKKEERMFKVGQEFVNRFGEIFVTYRKAGTQEIKTYNKSIQPEFTKKDVFDNPDDWEPADITEEFDKLVKHLKGE